MFLGLCPRVCAYVWLCGSVRARVIVPVYVSLLLCLHLCTTEARRRRGWQRKRWLDVITDSLDMSLSKVQEMVKDRGAWHAAAGHKELDTTEGRSNNSARAQTYVAGWTHLSSRLFRDPQILTPGPANPTE